MANPALGRKYACHNCATKFYDLNKPDAKCPKCGAPPEVAASEAAPKASRGGSKRGRAAPVYEPKVEEEDAPFDDATRAAVRGEVLDLAAWLGLAAVLPRSWR